MSDVALEHDDYESLPDRVHPAIHMLAGAMAGMGEHLALYPVDVVKTRMMRMNPDPEARYYSIRHAVKKMVRTEGKGSLFKGIVPVAVGAGPAHAMYFGVYEQAKLAFGANEGDDHHPMATAAAGALATLAHDGFMNPIEVVKQRLQVHGSPYTGVSDCIKTTMRNEGVSAFYLSLSTQVAMNIPFQVTHLVTYEFLRKTLNPAGTYDPTTHLVAGAAAGAVAAAVTTPFDVAKTLLNTQERCPGAKAARPGGEAQPVTRGLVAAFNTIYGLTGWRGFVRGMRPRVLFTMPGTAISWSVYEFFKHHLSAADEDQAP